MILYRFISSFISSILISFTSIFVDYITMSTKERTEYYAYYSLGGEILTILICLVLIYVFFGIPCSIFIDKLVQNNSTLTTYLIKLVLYSIAGSLTNFVVINLFFDANIDYFSIFYGLICAIIFYHILILLSLFQNKAVDK